MTAKPTKIIEIFYCYAHEDKIWLDELEKHLGALRRQGQISGWHDCDIRAGKEWRREIDAHLNTANIILLLVSPDFISSDYCYSIEMHRALERHKTGEARVIPIILRPVDYEGTPISELQVLPTGGKPISLWLNNDKAFWDVARGIREEIRVLLAQRAKEQWRGEDSTLPNIQPSNDEINANKQVPQTSYKIINSREAIVLFHHLMQFNTQTKVLRFVGEGKMGKSHLLIKVFPALAHQDYQAQCVILDLRSPVLTIPDILYDASSQLGSLVHDNYSAAYDNWINHSISTRNSIEDTRNRIYHLTAQFVKNLNKLDDKQLIFLFDSVNNARKGVQTWLIDILLTQLTALHHVRVVLAGRSLPETHSSYTTLCHTYRLHSITDEEAYIDYCQSLNAKLGEQSIRDFAYACDYIPGIFADLVLPRFVPEG